MLARRRLSISLNTAVSTVLFLGRTVNHRSMDARFRPTSKWKNATPPALRCRFGLHFRSSRGIDVVTAKITAKENLKMTTLIPEENGTPAATTASKKPKASKKARVAPRRANLAPAKAKSVRKAKAARGGSKTAKILNLLKRPGGATSKELMKATGWLPHSLRGFLSGTVRKKMGLTVTSTKGKDGERTYSVEA